MNLIYNFFSFFMLKLFIMCHFQYVCRFIKNIHYVILEYLTDNTI